VTTVINHNLQAATTGSTAKTHYGTR